MAVSEGSAAGYGWHPKEGCTVGVGFKTKSAKFFGALGEGKIHMMSVDKLDSDSFIAFLKEALEIYGMVIIVLDNASCHRSAKVRDFIESTHGSIRLFFLPSYTP